MFKLDSRCARALNSLSIHSKFRILNNTSQIFLLTQSRLFFNCKIMCQVGHCPYDVDICQRIQINLYSHNCIKVPSLAQTNIPPGFYYKWTTQPHCGIPVLNDKYALSINILEQLLDIFPFLFMIHFVVSILMATAPPCQSTIFQFSVAENQRTLASCSR